MSLTVVIPVTFKSPYVIDEPLPMLLATMSPLMETLPVTSIAVLEALHGSLM